MPARILSNMPTASDQVRHLPALLTVSDDSSAISGLRFRINIVMSIAGLPTSHSTATTVTNAACPIELSPSAG